MKKTIISGLLAAAFVIGLLAFFQFYLRAEVTISPVTRGVAIDAVPAIVSINHASILTLSSEEGGRITESELTLGESVTEGDLLIQIDTTELELEAEALESKIQHLETSYELRLQETIELEKFKEELENNERLYAAGNYPELEIKRRRREFQALQESQLRQQLNEKQQLENLRNQLKRIELRLENTSIHAPTSGIVNRVFALPGELIHPGGRIAEIHSEKLLVEAKINEEDFAGIKVGQDATVRLLAYGADLFPAEITHVQLPGADAESQQYTVFLKIEIDPELLLPGLSGEASIIRNRNPDSLLIPRQALFGDSVFVTNKQKAELRRVRTGARGLNQVEILEGLEEGEEVIVDGAANLRDGDKIQSHPAPNSNLQ